MPVIKVIKRGIYELAETRQQIKVLCLDGASYFWLSVPGLGHVLEGAGKHPKAECLLARGCYRVYDVDNELGFSNQRHLELCAGDGRWQGYLLLAGLPSRKQRAKMVPTREVISLSQASRLDSLAIN